jgi:hypothetical protein
MTTRTDLLLARVRALVAETRFAKRTRDNLVDNYAALLADAEETFSALKDERDEVLARLNARLVAEGLPELTIADFKDLP